MRTYGPSDISTARRLIAALVPPQVQCSVAVINKGLTLSVLIQAGGRMQRYEFGWTGVSETSPGVPAPHFSKLVAIQIGEEWETGAYVPHAENANRAPSPPTWVRNRAQLLSWVTASKPGETAIYHAGNLTVFRNTLQRRLIEINRIEDRRSGRMPLPAPLRRERGNLEDVRDMLGTIEKLNKEGVISLSQRRVDTETHYLATKGKTHMASNPAAVMALQKRLRNAVQAAWTPFVQQGAFKILNVGFEGSQDDTHDMTIKVELYRDNAQRPLHHRIPVSDLTDDQTRWPYILAQRATVVIKQLRAREGRAKNTKLTLDELS